MAASDHRREPASSRPGAVTPQWFDDLLSEHWEPVMRFFWKRVGGGEAEDLAQEVFASAWAAARRGRPAAGAASSEWGRFLMACSRNVMISRWRRATARSQAAALTELIGDECAPPASTASAGAPAAAGLVEREQSEALRDCLGALEPLPRMMCWLVFVEGRSRREAGRLLGRPEATVRATITTALGELRGCLERRGMAP